MRRLVLALVLVAGCARGQDPTVPDGSSPTTTTTAAPTSTTAPSTTTTTEPPIAPAQPATATCPAIPARAEPRADRPSYRMDLDVQLDANAVVGTQVVTFTPDLPTDRLVFRLWPNGPRPSGAGARLDVGEVRVDGTAVQAQQPNATTVVVPAELAAGETVEASVAFRLTLPGPVSDRISRRGDTVRLGTFHPVLAWEPGVGWAEHPPTALFAEATTAPVADWDVSVRVPAGLTVLAAGEQQADGRWRADALREFALAVGRFRVVEGQAGAPHPVPVTVAVESSLADSEHAYLDTVVRSLTDFGVRFGPYPYPRYTLVLTPDLRGGIEYPAFVHQGPGTNDRTTPHEVGHMWFYALVGNSQGRDPWLDEGLATYAEARFLGNLSSFVARDVPAAGKGRAGEPMTFWEPRSSAYYRSVYVQGAQAVAALGDADRVDCALRLHVARNAHAIATNASFVDAVDDVFPDARATLGRFGIASG